MERGFLFVKSLFLFVINWLKIHYPLKSVENKSEPYLKSINFKNDNYAFFLYIQQKKLVGTGVFNKECILFLRISFFSLHQTIMPAEFKKVAQI